MKTKTTVFYRDDQWNQTTKEKATQAEIREYDETGKCVRAVYGRFVSRAKPENFDEHMRSHDEEDRAK